MSSNFNISEDVEKFVKYIISNYKWDPVSDIKYLRGFDVGDGYASKGIIVDITKGKKMFKLFLKCALDIDSSDFMPVEKLYSNEMYFYDVVYPTFRKFLKDRGVEDDFRNVPKCYGTSKKRIIALENLKAKRFKLFDRKNVMNNNHITMVLRTFAKFHAISFSLMDQDKKTYDVLLENISDIVDKKLQESPMEKIMRNVMNEFLVKLDPIEDKKILDKCNVDELVRCLRDAQQPMGEYSIITQGDCWCNNMMFLYEEKESENPVDIMLIDWQLLHVASPAFDVSYFYYSIGCEESLRQLQRNLKFYHKELSKQIRNLGSDPDVVYPFEIMMKEWRQHCKYGFATAFMLLRVMLSSHDEVLNFETMDSENIDSMENLYPKFAREDQYVSKMKILARFMIENDLDKFRFLT